MSVWLTPELKPFFGGTYFPPEDRHGRVGFKTLIQRIAQVWRDERQTLLEYGEKSEKLLVDDASRQTLGSIASAEVAIAQCLDELVGAFDPEFGGFGSAPKFPMPGNLFLLVESIARQNGSVDESRLKEMLEGTLDHMAKGGMWDHVGGGFHRYSVDKYWHVPHYEKMLYDQGQLASVYAEAYRLSGRREFANVAMTISKYVARDLLGPEGGIFAAEDADSVLPSDADAHGEGVFYIWSQTELRAILGEKSELFEDAFGVKVGGNARPESDPHGELKGMNTLFRHSSDAELAERFGMSEEEIASNLELSVEKLFKCRESRPRPHLDDKVIVSWNALMVSGACKVYQICGDYASMELARKSAAFLWSEMWAAEDKRFRRSYRGKPGNAFGFAEDYAAAANAFIDVYECAFDTVWLERSLLVVQQLRGRFEDAQRGGFFASESGDPSLIVRLRDNYDGAEPSASSMAAIAMLRLAAIFNDSELRDAGRKTIEAFGEQWSRSPRSMPLMLVAALRFLEGDQQIVIVGDPREDATRELLGIVNRKRKPYSVLVLIDSSQSLPKLFESNASVKAMSEAVDRGRAVAYVCDNYACKAPVTSKQELEKMLAGEDA